MKEKELLKKKGGKKIDEKLLFLFQVDSLLLSFLLFSLFSLVSFFFS